MSDARRFGPLLIHDEDTYTKQMKTAVLGVSMKLLKQKGAVCVEVAEAMAIGALTRSPADIAIAVTGWPALSLMMTAIRSGFCFVRPPD
jgi:nicotinamide mononucleotide (NMN) deamidase PncC